MKDDAMIMEVLRKMQEGSALQCEVAKVELEKSSEQAKAKRIPLMDISMVNQLNRSSNTNTIGLKAKGN